MDINFNEFRELGSTCWQTKYQTLTFELSEEIQQGKNRLGLYSFLLQHQIHFGISNERLSKYN